MHDLRDVESETTRKFFHGPQMTTNGITSGFFSDISVLWIPKDHHFFCLQLCMQPARLLRGCCDRAREVGIIDIFLTCAVHLGYCWESANLEVLPILSSLTVPRLPASLSARGRIQIKWMEMEKSIIDGIRGMKNTLREMNHSQLFILFIGKLFLAHTFKFLKWENFHLILPTYFGLTCSLNIKNSDFHSKKSKSLSQRTTKKSEPLLLCTWRIHRLSQSLSFHHLSDDYHVAKRNPQTIAFSDLLVRCTNSESSTWCVESLFTWLLHPKVPPALHSSGGASACSRNGLRQCSGSESS